jgi:hypothetical protein
VLKAILQTAAFCLTCYITYPLAVDSGYYPTGWLAHFMFVLGVYGIFYILEKR